LNRFSAVADSARGVVRGQATLKARLKGFPSVPILE